jgi:hypothetical protein
MSLSKIARKGICKHLLALIASNAIVMSASAQQWIEVEDFLTDTDKGDATTAEWDTVNGVLELGLPPPLTNPAISREPLGDSGGEDLRDSRAIALGDFDGDGQLDVVIGNEGPDGVGARNIVYPNVDNGTGNRFATAAIEIGDASDLFQTLDIAVGDLNNDGHLDVIAGNFGAPAVYYLNDGSGTLDAGTLGSRTEFTEARRTWAIAVADFDNDGDLDYIEANSGASGQDGQQNSLYLNRLLENNTLSFSQEILLSTQAEKARSRAIALGDIDNDGDIDIVFGEQPTNVHPGNNTCHTWGGSGFSSPVSVQPTSAFLTFAVKLADVNGDGFLDLIEGNQGAPTYVYLNNFPNSGVACDFSARQVVGNSLAIDTTVSIEVADFDMDGFLDIFEGNNGDRDDDGDESNDLPQPVRLFLGNGDGTFANGLDETPPKQKIYGTDFGDVDGDGQLDLVSASSDEEQPPNDPLPVVGGNAVYYNIGTPGGTPVRQLYSTAISIQDVGAIGRAIDSGALRYDPFPTATHASLKYYLSNDNGATWIEINPLRAVGFPNRFSTQLMWRVDMTTLSPVSASLPQVDLLTISDNRPPRFLFPNDATNREDIQAAIGENFSVGMTNFFSDLEDHKMNFVATGLPDNFDLNPLSGVLSGIPTPDQANTPIDFEVEAFDGFESRVGFFTLNVAVGAGTPTITLNGDNPITIKVGDTFTDPGAAAIDFEDGDISADIVVAGDTVNTAVVGTYVITYNVTDSDGNAAIEVERAVNVVEDGVPTIELNGDATINLNVGGTFTDPGATASDPEDGDLTASIVVGGDTVNTAVAATYEITYNVSDSDGNAADTVIRTVIVSSVTGGGTPTITLNGSATVTITVGDSFTDPGATASDPEDGNISADIVVGGDTVDTATAGTYVITYNVADSDGNAAPQVTRTVIVAIGGVPTITLNGNAAVSLTVGDSFTDPGATASDPEDGDLTADIVVGGDAVNTSAAGTYVITYNVTDSDGNAAAQVTRTVTVRAPSPPPSGGGGGGGMTGAWELIGLMFAGLVGFRRRRAGKIAG